MYKKTNKITIVGFGWASIGFLQEIDTSIYDVHVISDKDEFAYTPYLAQNVRNDYQITVRQNTLNKHITFHTKTVQDVDFAKQWIRASNYTDPNEGDSLHKYEYLIFAHGADVNTFGIPGVQEHTLFLKTSEHSKTIGSRLAQLPDNATVAIIGCGLTGSELVGTLLDYGKYHVVAIDAMERPLPMFDATLSKMAVDLWAKENVSMYFKSAVSKVQENRIEFKDKPPIPFDLAIWCGGIKASAFTQKINQELSLVNTRGIPVGSDLQVQNADKIYAMGDCAVSGLPSTAQVAYQQGKYLAREFNDGFQKKRIFEYKEKGQIGYIGKGQSIYQSKMFQGGGNLVYYLNNLVHLYNFSSVYMNEKMGP
jgi:NADH:ubiquinone reductase (non-electrogenic)